MRLHHFMEYLSKMSGEASDLLTNLPPDLPEAQEVFRISENLKTVKSFIEKNYNLYSQIDVQKIIAEMSEEEREDLRKYSIEMLNHGLSIKPYDFICVSFLFLSGENHILFISESDKVEKSYDFLIANCSPEKQFGNIGIGNVIFENGDLYVDNYDVIIPLIPRTPENEERTEKEALHLGQLAGTVFLIICAMLQSKNIETVLIKSSDKLNKSRAKKGKMPINDIREIRINYNGKRYLADGREEGGTHASPRLHWRRGHIRRLSDGKLTNVRPTLVGEIKGQEPKMPIYKVTKGNLHA